MQTYKITTRDVPFKQNPWETRGQTSREEHGTTLLDK